jgi:N-glycosylase/DNA lyase
VSSEPVTAHIKDIFIGCGVCEEKPSDYTLQKTITQIAEASGTTAFAVDKIFWMIGSGQIGSINIGAKKKEFIEMYQKTKLKKSNAF